DPTSICSGNRTPSTPICPPIAASAPSSLPVPQTRPQPPATAAGRRHRSTLPEDAARMTAVNAVSASHSSPSPSADAPEFSGAGLLCVVAMLNHVALTGGRITVSLTALQLGLSTFIVGGLVAVFAVIPMRSGGHTSELQSRDNHVCRLLLEKQKVQSRQT